MHEFKLPENEHLIDIISKKKFALKSFARLIFVTPCVGLLEKQKGLMVQTTPKRLLEIWY